MTRGQNIRYRALLLLNRGLGLLPTWFLYGPVLWFLYFLLYRVARYRVRTVRANLRGAFPEKPRRELRRIERRFYLHLAEIFLDAVDMVSISEKEARGRVVFENAQEHEARVEGRDWIAAMAHYGSWEYFSVYQFHTSAQVAGVYKPVHDKAFDAFYRYSRSRFGLEPVSMKVLMRYILTKKAEGRRIAVGMIADQSARPNEHTMWFDFLGRKTIFYAGIERLAVRFGMPVYFTETRKVGRTRYVSRFVEIYDGREKLPEGEITYRYARKLEENILRAPEYWIWSHKRWKHPFGPGSRYYTPETGAVTMDGESGTAPQAGTATQADATQTDATTRADATIQADATTQTDAAQADATTRADATTQVDAATPAGAVARNFSASQDLSAARNGSIPPVDTSAQDNSAARKPTSHPADRNPTAPSPEPEKNCANG